MILENYNPGEVLTHFEAISQIPRGSGNEKAVSDYIAQFASDLGHRVVQDPLNNLVIFKNPTAGYENNPPIILQAHLDMVCEKNVDTTHDFLTDPIHLYVDGDFIKAKGTTLGADNGLGVAMCMALLQATDIPHPPLEIILTVEEETGMAGAMGLDYSLLQGKRMVNLDNSNDSKFVMGCAAGATVACTMPVEWVAVDADKTALTITVGGLIGGHSGSDIAKERGNAICILGQVLSTIHSQIPVGIANIAGGMKVNAIPREATATITIPKNQTSAVASILEACQNDLAIQFRATDPGLTISSQADSVGKVLTGGLGEHVIALLTLFPNGVHSRSMEIPGLVNASCNLGVAETTHEHFKILAMPRGAATLYLRQVERVVKSLGALLGAAVDFTERSPAWPYNPNSALLNSALPYYAPIFGEAPIIGAIHAGLECGLFAEKIPGLDIISIGPTNIDLHTPDERISLKSTAQYWEFICKLLGAL